MNAPSFAALQKLSEKQIKGTSNVIEILDIDDIDLPQLVRGQANIDTEGELVETLRDNRDGFGDLIEASYGIFVKFAASGFGAGENLFSQIILGDLH